MIYNPVSTGSSNRSGSTLPDDLLTKILEDGEELDIVGETEVTIPNTPDSFYVYIAFCSSIQVAEESLIVPVHVGASGGLYTPVSLLTNDDAQSTTVLSILPSAAGVLLSTDSGATLDRLRLVSATGDEASWHIDQFFALIV